MAYFAPKEEPYNWRGAANDLKQGTIMCSRSGTAPEGFEVFTDGHIGMSISILRIIQRARKRFVNLAKEDPGRARQKS